MTLHFIKKVKPEGKDLRQLLHGHLSGYIDGRPIKTLHASEVTKENPGFCARRKALMVHTGQENPDEFLSTSLSVTFNIGRRLEEDVQHWFADMGRAVGHWDCRFCHSKYKFQKRPAKCTSCGGTLFKYREVRAQSQYAYVSAGLDLLVDKSLPSGKLTYVEIKTIDKEEFKKLAMPLAEHRARTRLALRLIEESDDPFLQQVATDRAEVLYVSKGGFGCATPEVAQYPFPDAQFSPFKPYAVERDDASIEQYYAEAIKYAEYIASGAIPCRICATTFSPQAKGCKQMLACFQTPNKEA